MHEGVQTLPKAAGSHWMILPRRMICFREDILVCCGANGGMLGVEQRESGVQRAWGVQLEVCPGECREVDSFERCGEEGRVRDLSQFHVFALRDPADRTAPCLPRTERGAAGEGWARAGCWPWTYHLGATLPRCTFKWVKLNLAETGELAGAKALFPVLDLD